MKEFKSSPSYGGKTPHEEATPVSFRNLWRFLAFAKPYWPWTVGGLVASFLRLALPMAIPLFFKYVIDDVLRPEDIMPSERWAMLRHIMPIALLLVLCQPVFVLCRFYLPARAALPAVRDIRFELFKHLQRLSISFYTKRPSGSVVARVVHDVQVAASVFDGLLIMTAQNLIMVLAMSSYLLWTDWRWALMPLATVPLFAGTTHMLRRPMRKAWRSTRDAVERISGHIQERVGMIREVQSFTAEEKEQTYVWNEADALKTHATHARFFKGLLFISSELVSLAGQVVVILFGIHRYNQGLASIGEIQVFYLYTKMMLDPAAQIADSYGELQQSAASADRIFEFFDEKPEIHDQPGATALQATEKCIRFENVSFSYPAQEPVAVLRDVSLEAPSGWRIALVGESGSGKSTLMNLLPRFYDVQSGRVTIDGQDVRHVTVRSLRQAIGIVPQESVLFSGTIRDNLRYGRPDATDKEIYEAANLANAAEFILAQQDGYDTSVGERGVTLSGGQVQRLAIARAFLKDPPILILDEATSNLDALSEALVLEALDRLLTGRTSFTIAHRLSTARGADLIVVLHAGQIIEKGRHEELLAKNGKYAQLWKRQMELSLSQPL